MDRYDIKFKVQRLDGKVERFYVEMMCVPRQGEELPEFHTDEPVNPRHEEYEGETIDLQIKSVEYPRVGKYEDGSHQIIVHAVEKENS